MTHTIDVSAFASTRDHDLVIDAPTAGLSPGEWPQTVRVVFAHGVSLCFFRMRFDSKLGEVTGARYLTGDGKYRLLIVNH